MRLEVKASAGSGNGTAQDNDRIVCDRDGVSMRRRVECCSAQGLTRFSPPRRSPRPGEDRLLVDAKEIIYNNDKNTIAASGDVQLNYQGRSLQADRVIYDRNTGRVYAEGHAKLTDEKGAVLNADRFELTDDFKSGFIDSLRWSRPRSTMAEVSRPGSRPPGRNVPPARPRPSNVAPTRPANPARTIRKNRLSGR